MNWLSQKGKDLIGVCPECHAPKLNYNPGKKNSHTGEVGMGICNACGMGFSRSRLERLWGESLEEVSRKPLEPMEPPTPPPADLMWCHDHSLAMAQIKERPNWYEGYPEWGPSAQYSPSQQRYFFRLSRTTIVRDSPIVWASRSIWPEDKGWRMSGPVRGKFWGSINYGPEGKPLSPLILMEGIGDVIGTRLYGSAIALLGTKMSEEIQSCLFQIGCRNLVIWFDQDGNGAGQAGAERLKRQLQGLFSVKVLTHGHPKNISPEEARSLICNV